jgi:WD40 repeat protein
MLASGSYDGKVVVWTSKPAGPGGYAKFDKAFEWRHGSSVNCVTWAPAEAGNLILAVACSDGSVVVLRRAQTPDGHPVRLSRSYCFSWTMDTKIKLFPMSLGVDLDANRYLPIT